MAADGESPALSEFDSERTETKHRYHFRSKICESTVCFLARAILTHSCVLFLPAMVAIPVRSMRVELLSFLQDLDYLDPPAIQQQQDRSLASAANGASERYKRMSPKFKQICQASVRGFRVRA